MKTFAAAIFFVLFSFFPAAAQTENGGLRRLSDKEIDAQLRNMLDLLPVEIQSGILFGGILGMLLSLGLLLPSLELTVRRIHDLGKPWFWLLISLVPFIGGIALLIWFCMPGETKANQWGEPVK